jgi:hypothetical protein
VLFELRHANRWAFGHYLVVAISTITDDRVMAAGCNQNCNSVQPSFRHTFPFQSSPDNYLQGTGTGFIKPLVVSQLIKNCQLLRSSLLCSQEPAIHPIIRQLNPLQRVRLLFTSLRSILKHAQVSQEGSLPITFPDPNVLCISNMSAKCQAHILMYALKLSEVCLHIINPFS